MGQKISPNLSGQKKSTKLSGKKKSPNLSGPNLFDFKIFLKHPRTLIVSYFKARYLRGFKTKKTDFSAVSPLDTDISKILIWFTYTKKKGVYVKHTLRKYLSTSFKNEEMFQIGR